MEPVRLGIIGCGIAARELHWPALSEMPGMFKITAVCNHTGPKAKSFAEMVGGVPYVLDYHELLDRKDVEAVSIILPFGLNRVVAEDCLRAGRHVMIEKPLAASITDAEKMLLIEERYAPLVMMVAENFRYRALYRRAKTLLDGGSIGTPYAAIWNFFTDVSSGANTQYMSTAWRFDRDYPGGFLVDGGVHIIAALRLLFGEFSRLSAQSRSVNPDAGRVDTLTAECTFAGGVAGQINMFYSSRGLKVNTIYIFGDAGTMLVDNYGDTVAVKKPGMPDITEKCTEERGYVGEYEDFCRAIRTGSPVVSTFREAFIDLNVITRALESAEAGTIVRFD
ncbi:Gfo/Idh/MocA family oxidoreductase [bacterium]|nr:Gfo/Idh/MocA family oxidoreductase [bacterium]